jgi:hypothetical protein
LTPDQADDLVMQVAQGQLGLAELAGRLAKALDLAD